MVSDDEYERGFRDGRQMMEDEIEGLQKEALKNEVEAYNQGFNNGAQNLKDAEYRLKGVKHAS